MRRLIEWILSLFGHHHDKPKPPEPPKPPVVPVWPPKIMMEIKKKSFFSLYQKKDGTILAGDYSWPDAHSHIYDVKKKKPVMKFDCGESVFDMLEDGGNFWVATEDRGMVFKNGKLYVRLSGSHHWHGAYTVAKIKGKIVIGGADQVYVDGYGETLKFHNTMHNKWVVPWKDYAWSIGFDYTKNKGCIIKSHDLRAWKHIYGPERWRYMHAVPVGDKMFLLGTSNYHKGKHHRNSAAVFVTYNGNGFQLLKTFNGYDYISKGALAKKNGKLYFGLTRGWRSQKTGCQLWVNEGNNYFVKMATFGEAELRDILPTDEGIYVATRTDGKRGRVYLVDYRYREK